MAEYYESTIAPAVETLIKGRQENRFTIVKHYNTFEITAQDAEKIQAENPDLYVSYRHFNGSKMIEAFDPFVTVIRDIYKTFEADKTPREFIGQFSVYIPQRSVFEAMLTETLYKRKEDILLDELEYEKEQMLKSMVAILTTLAEKHPFLFILNNLNMASQSTIMLLLELAKANSEKIFVYGAFNELYSQPTHMVTVWERFVEQLEDHNCIVDGGSSEEIAVEEEGSYFHFESGYLSCLFG